MLVILNSLNAHNLPVFQQSLMTFLSKFMVHRALPAKTYLSLGLLSKMHMRAMDSLNCLVRVMNPVMETQKKTQNIS